MVTYSTRHEVRIDNSLLYEIKNHRGWFIGLGIIFLALGVLAIAFPWVATLSLELAIGIIFVIAGIAIGVQSFFIRRWKGLAMNLGLAVLALITGLLMLFFPLAGVFTLTTLVMLYFLLTGATKTWFAVRVRPANGWGWILTSGLLSLALGVLILFQMAAFLPWILGLLLGVDFIFGGFWMLVLAAKARHLS